MTDKNWIKSGPEPGFYKLAKKEIVGYSLVDFAMNIVFQSIMMFITFYYTDVYLLKPSHVAVMFLVSRIWDTINDPMMGTIVERLNPKQGKYKPYIKWGAIPFGVAAVLTFTVPDFGYTGKLIWAYATYNLLNMLYTFIIQPYISTASVMTMDPDERTKLQSVRMMLAQSGGVVVALTIPTFSNILGGDNIAKGYQRTVMILAVIMVILLFYAVSTMIERIKIDSHEDPITAKDFFTQITHNKPGVIMFLLFLGVYGFTTLSGGTGPYYMTYFADRPDLVSVYSLMHILPSVFGVPIVPALTRKIKKKGTVILGLALPTIGCGLSYLLSPSAVVAMIILKGLAGFGYGILMGILWAMITDSVEYAEWNTGKRYTALVMTLIGLGLKFSMTIGGVIPTAILDSVNYVPNVQQTAEALQGIRFMSTLLPGLVCLVTLIIFALFYDLTEEKLQKIMHENAVRQGLVEEKMQLDSD
ncbi:MAG: MFS transporter [Fastidiosipilaceae bacterium]|jgi:GPH family glycoside/pentoside/hexuronide:cation symporter|nr:MFS transporter [Clostridiaceae bacterium]